MESSAAVPNIVEEPADGKLALWLFILSEVMLFGGFLSSYFMLRLGSPVCGLGVPAWPRAGYTGGLFLATLNTLILITSSFTAVRALGSARRADRRGLSSHLLATVLLGAAFLAVKAFEYAAKIHHGYGPGGALVQATPGLGIFISFYFALTGLHALHVVAGMAWNFLLWRAGRRVVLNEAFGNKVEYAALYWHFVDVVWVFLYPLFYLI